MFRSLFGRKTAQPPGNFVFLRLETDGLPEIWMLNHKVDTDIERAAFPWHLTIDIEMKEAHEIGLPTDAEQRDLTKLRETLDVTLLTDKNALWLGCMTWNRTRQLIYRVRIQSPVNEYLTALMGSSAAMRPMQHRMVPDASWEQAEYYLEPLLLDSPAAEPRRYAPTMISATATTGAPQ